jgi:adenylate kinase family enzyme
MCIWSNANEQRAKVGKPAMVISFDCPQGVAQERFLQRNREAGDNQEMFDKRYAEFQHNHQMISGRYWDILQKVS